MRRPQIAVIGSASGDPALLSLARNLGEAIVDRGWRIVCGGLAGVMHAVASGAHQSAAATGGDVIGVLPTLDSNTANPFIDIVLPTGMQYARNALVVGAGDVVVAVGGGAGTLSEIALAWQLKKPIVALACSDGWAAELAGRQLDGRRDDRLHAAKDVQEALTLTANLLALPRQGHVGF
ncbi:MAG: TIGR00725 family protein [Nannocystaceae bacterium]